MDGLYLTSRYPSKALGIYRCLEALQSESEFDSYVLIGAGSIQLLVCEAMARYMYGAKS